MCVDDRYYADYHASFSDPETSMTRVLDDLLAQRTAAAQGAVNTPVAPGDVKLAAVKPEESDRDLANALDRLTNTAQYTSETSLLLARTNQEVGTEIVSLTINRFSVPLK